MKKPIIFLDVDGVLNTDSMIASSADHKGKPNDNTPFGEWCKDRATLIREFAIPFRGLLKYSFFLLYKCY